MTPEHCQAIVEHLPVIRALAKGKPVYFAAFRYDGKFLGWRSTHKVLIGPLMSGYYSVKPRYSCMKPGKPTEIPYPHQSGRNTRKSSISAGSERG